MIAIIRIKGMVDRNADIANTLDRLRLRRKYSCVVVKENDIVKGMLKKVRSFVAYGKIDDATLKTLIDKRGLKIDKNKGVGDVKDLKFEEANLKPFFRLHPPRKGIDSKQHFPKGVLGDHGDKIKELIGRML
jgi:large subunit ribosomal protein L30